LKILITNSRNKHLLAPQYFDGLKKLNVDVLGTYYLDTLEEWLSGFLFKRILFRIYPKLFYSRLNKELLRDVITFNPDVVWIFKGMEVLPSSLQQIKNRGIKLVNYNPDHPFRYVSRGSGNGNVKKSIPLFNLYISYSRIILDELKERCPQTTTFYLPFGYHDYVDNLKFASEEIIRICFVGHADEKRAKFISTLAKSNLEIDLYGAKWSKYFKKKIKNINIYSAVTGEQYWGVLRKYRVQLNLFRDHNIQSHNMRSFEIPAVGGIMLANYSVEQSSFFEDGKEAFYFTSDEELLQKAKFILSMDSESADIIRNFARKRSKDSLYSYSERCKLVLNEFNRLFNE
jgi:hypothetical protein